MKNFKKIDMKAGITAIVLCSIMIAVSFSGCTQQQQGGGGNPEIKNPTTYVRYDIGEPKTLDPAEAYDSASTDMVNNIYDRLVTYKGNDTKTIYPSLATDWSVADDQITWTFHLRQGVTFSNGDTFDANDVKYSFDRVLIVNSPDSGVAWILSQCMDTNSTTVVDPYTVQIKLTDTYGGFLALLAFTVASVVDQEYVEAHGGVVADTDNVYMKENPVGTGPYMLDHWTHNSEIVLKQNPQYWGGWSGNHVQTVVVKSADEASTRILALENGDADFAYIPYENLVDIRNKTGVEIFQAPSYDVVLGIFDCVSNNTFMADKNVRKALSYAFDYQSAIDDAYNGYLYRLPGCIPEGMPYYETQNNGNPVYNFNLVQAGQILNESGYTQTYLFRGNYYRFNNTAIRIWYNSGNAERQKMALTFQQNLAKLGINSVVSTEGWPQYLNRMYRTNDWDYMFLGWMPDYNDPDDYVAPFVGSAAIGGDTFNTGWANATVDTLILRAKFNVSTQIRSDSYAGAFNIYINDPNLIYIGQNTYTRGMRTWLQGYSYNPVLEYYYYNYYKAYA
jgi:peptide/nickel transport system substrate-binding protein